MVLFRKNSAAPTSATPADADTDASGKGRATPSRKQAVMNRLPGPVSKSGGQRSQTYKPPAGTVQRIGEIVRGNSCSSASSKVSRLER